MSSPHLSQQNIRPVIFLVASGGHFRCRIWPQLQLRPVTRPGLSHRQGSRRALVVLSLFQLIHQLLQHSLDFFPERYTTLGGTISEKKCLGNSLGPFLSTLQGSVGIQRVIKHQNWLVWGASFRSLVRCNIPYWTVSF
jgi:hypothetical protein